MSSPIDDPDTITKRQMLQAICAVGFVGTFYTVFGGIRTVIWATGFRSSFDWIELPITDATGKLCQYRGVSEISGLYFLGLRRLYKVKSSFMLGIGDDAAYLAEQITEGRSG